MAKKEKGTRQKKKQGRSTQELLGIKTFTKYGIAVGKYELLFYMIAPTNISVLSRANIEIKIHHLMMVLSAVPDIEVTCTDSCECFDDNKTYLPVSYTHLDGGQERTLCPDAVPLLPGQAWKHPLFRHLLSAERQ